MITREQTLIFFFIIFFTLSRINDGTNRNYIKISNDLTKQLEITNQDTEKLMMGILEFIKI